MQSKHGHGEGASPVLEVPVSIGWDRPIPEAVGRALSRLPSGLFIVTAGTGKNATGMLASWTALPVAANQATCVLHRS